MSRSSMRVKLLLASLALAPCTAWSASDGCLGASPLQIRVRISGVTPDAGAAALLSGAAPGLQLRDAISGALWWTAGAAPGNSLRLAGMDAPFIGRPAALDLDGDGLHDRLYAVDLMGRLWRLDLHAGRPLREWAAGGVLAELAGGDPLRRFVAGPDIILQAGAGEPRRVDIAVGSASLGSAPADNRFFVIHDHHPYVAWSDRPDRAALPVQGAGLRSSAGPPVTGGSQRTREAGFQLPLGAGQVLAPSLTLAGRIHFSLAHARLADRGHCLLVLDMAGQSDVEVLALDATSGEAITRWPAASRDSRSAVRLAPAGTGRPDFLDCMIAGDVLPGCRVDVRLHRRYWYLEGVD